MKRPPKDDNNDQVPRKEARREQKVEPLNDLLALFADLEEREGLDGNLSSLSPDRLATNNDTGPQESRFSTTLPSAAAAAAGPASSYFGLYHSPQSPVSPDSRHTQYLSAQGDYAEWMVQPHSVDFTNEGACGTSPYPPPPKYHPQEQQQQQQQHQKLPPHQTERLQHQPDQKRTSRASWPPPYCDTEILPPWILPPPTQPAPHPPSFYWANRNVGSGNLPPPSLSYHPSSSFQYPPSIPDVSSDHESDYARTISISLRRQGSHEQEIERSWSDASSCSQNQHQPPPTWHSPIQQHQAPPEKEMNPNDLKRRAGPNKQPIGSSIQRTSSLSSRASSATSHHSQRPIGTSLHGEQPGYHYNERQKRHSDSLSHLQEVATNVARAASPTSAAVF